MYSPSRQSYRKRKTNTYKKRVNRLYAPGLSTADLPSYYQKKGRTIQLSPRTIYNPITSIPPPDEYKQMYNKLVDVGYIKKNLPVLPYLVELSTEISLLFEFQEGQSESSHVNNVSLVTLIGAQDLTPLPAGYVYKASVLMINYDAYGGVEPFNTYLTLHNPIISGGGEVILVHRSANAEISGAINYTLTLAPILTRVLKVYQLSLSGSSVAFNPTNKTTTADLDTSTDYYPFISSNDSESYLYMTRGDTNGIPQGNMTLMVKIEAIPDQ